MNGILAKKLGMTQVFTDNGECVPVTVLEAGPCVVVCHKTEEKDGYTAIQVGFGLVKESRADKATIGHFKKANLDVRGYLAEFDVENLEDWPIGKEFGADVPEEVKKEIIDGLRANFEGECTEVGMYLAMARVAHREGYPEIGMYWEKAGLEEAEHAAKFAELLGEVVTDSTKKNLEMRVEAENGATKGKTDLAKLAKQYNLDAIHDTVHEMARDEARHGKAFAGLLKRYFGK